MASPTSRGALVATRLASPVLLVVSRLVQGLALGGEVGAASAVLLEAAPLGQKARYISLRSLSQGVATVLAGLVGLTLARSPIVAFAPLNPPRQLTSGPSVLY